MFWVSRASRPWGFIVGDPPLCASIAVCVLYSMYVTAGLAVGANL